MHGSSRFRSVPAGLCGSCTADSAGICEALPEWLCHFTFSQAIWERSSFSASLPAFGVITIFNFSRSDMWAMIPCHGLSLCPGFSALHIPSSVKPLFPPFVHVIFLFSLMNSESLFYPVDTSSLWNRSWLRAGPVPGRDPPGLHLPFPTPNRCFAELRVSISMKSHLPSVSFYGSCFWCQV